MVLLAKHSGTTHLSPTAAAAPQPPLFLRLLDPSSTASFHPIAISLGSDWSLESAVISALGHFPISTFQRVVSSPVSPSGKVELVGSTRAASDATATFY